MPLQRDQSERLFEISAALDWGTLKRPEGRFNGRIDVGIGNLMCVLMCEVVRRERRVPVQERNLQVASSCEI